MSKVATAGIADGKVVNLAYTLKNAESEVLDQADSTTPFTYLHGAHQIVPGLEVALVGLNPGDKKEVRVSASEGYGEIDPNLKLIVARAQFPKNVQLEMGMEFEAATPEGSGAVFRVEALEGEQVHINGNHPLAGVELHFFVEVLSLRDATSEEVKHGHAHGEDGHHHH